MLAWLQPQPLVQWAAIAIVLVPSLPVMKADSVEASQQVRRLALISLIPTFLLLHQLIIFDLAGLMQEQLAYLLKKFSDFFIQFLQGHSIFTYT